MLVIWAGQMFIGIQFSVLFPPFYAFACIYCVIGNTCTECSAKSIVVFDLDDSDPFFPRIGLSLSLCVYLFAFTFFVFTSVLFLLSIDIELILFGTHQNLIVLGGFVTQHFDASCMCVCFGFNVKSIQLSQ